MPGAQIALDQDRPLGSSPGTPGVARNDGWVGRTVRPRSALINSSYAWTLLAAPPGSTSFITNPTLQVCAFTPDLPGTYRVQLITNGGGTGNVQILVIRCRFDVNGVLVNQGIALPGFGETAPESNYPGNEDGWGEPLDELVAYVLTLSGGGGSIVPVEDNARSARAARAGEMRSIGVTTTLTPAAMLSEVTGLGRVDSWVSGPATAAALALGFADGTFVCLDALTMAATNAGSVTGGGPVHVYCTGGKAIFVGATSAKIEEVNGGATPVSITSPSNFGGYAVTIPGTGNTEILLITSPADNTIYYYNLTSGGAVGVSYVGAAGSTPTGICVDNEGNVWVNFTTSGTVLTASLVKFTNNGSGVLVPAGVSVTGFLCNTNIVFDGRYIWGVYSNGTNAVLNKVRLADRTLTSSPLTTNASSRSSVLFDGELIVVSTTNALIKVHPDTLEQKVTQAVSSTDLGALTLSPDGKSVFYSSMAMGTPGFAKYKNPLASEFDRLSITSIAANKMLYTNANGEVAALPGGTNGQAIILVGGVPTWANLPSGFTAGGDLSGTSSSQTVVGFDGTPLDASMVSPADGVFIQKLSGKWKAVTAAAVAAAITLVGDVNGAASANHVDSLTGTGGLTYLASSTALGLNGNVTYGTLGRLRVFDSGSGTNVIGGYNGTTSSVLMSWAGSPSVGQLNLGADNSGANGVAYIYMWTSQYIDMVQGGVSKFIFDGNNDFALGNALIYYDVSTPFTIVHRGQSSDVATNNTTIRAQYAYAGATGAHQQPGNILIDVGAPTNGGTTEAYVSFTRNGVEQARIGAYGPSTTQEYLWLGSAAAFSNTNSVLVADASSFTYLNAPSFISAVGLISANAHYLLLVPTTQDRVLFGSNSTTAMPVQINWSSTLSPLLQTGTNASQFIIGTTKVNAKLILQYDATAAALSVDKTTSFGAGAANWSVPLVVQSGADGAGNSGVLVTRGGLAAANGIVLLGAYNSTDGAFWAGSAAASPSVSNYSFLSDGTSTWFNAPSGSGNLNFYTGNTTQLGQWNNTALYLQAGFIGLSGISATYGTLGQIRHSGAGNIIGGYSGAATYVTLSEDNAGGLYVGTASTGATNMYGFTYLGGTSGVAVLNSSFVTNFFLSNTNNIAYFGGAVGSAPVEIDWSTATTPWIHSGTNATQITVGTNRASASTYIASDANATNVQFQKASANIMRSIWLDPAGANQLFFDINNSATTISWMAQTNTWTLEWLVGVGELALNSTSFAVGGSTWWVTANNTATYFGAYITSAAPVQINYSTSTTPFIQSGTSATQLTIGTNNASSVLYLAADANLTVMRLEKVSSTSNQTDFYSPNGTAQFNINVTNSGIATLQNSVNNNYIQIIAQTYAQVNFNSSGLTYYANGQSFQNYAATTTWLQFSNSAGTVGIGFGTAITTLTGGQIGTWRDSSGSFTLDTTTTDFQVHITATQSVTMITPVKGRYWWFLIDATGGSAITLTLVQHASEKINGVAASWVYTFPAGYLGKFLLQTNGTDYYFT